LQERSVPERAVNYSRSACRSAVAVIGATRIASGARPRQQLSVCKQYILQGLGIGAMSNQIICTSELADGSIVPVLPDWSVERLDVQMIYPFHLSFSTRISAFYDTACEIIIENSARS
jgi:hypothetical protein